VTVLSFTVGCERKPPLVTIVLAVQGGECREYTLELPEALRFVRELEGGEHAQTFGEGCVDMAALLRRGIDEAL